VGGAGSCPCLCLLLLGPQGWVGQRCTHPCVLDMSIESKQVLELFKNDNQVQNLQHHKRSRGPSLVPYSVHRSILWVCYPHWCHQLHKFDDYFIAGYGPTPLRSDTCLAACPLEKRHKMIGFLNPSSTPGPGNRRCTARKWLGSFKTFASHMAFCIEAASCLYVAVYL